MQFAQAKSRAPRFNVFESEPPVGSPLLEVDKIVLTPHLGASTAEAQVKVAVDVAQQVLDVLAGKPARSAVNVIPVSAEMLRRQEPYMALTEKLGRLQGQLAEGPLTAVELVYAGELAEDDSRMLTRSFLKGLLQPILDIPVNIVNSALIAQQRGLKVTESRSTETAEYVSLVTARVFTDGEGMEVAGTLFGRASQRVVRISGFPVDFAPSGHMLVSLHLDKPGMIGHVGTLLGERQINIAGMSVGRSQPGPGGQSIMVLALDSAIPPAVMVEIRQLDGIITTTLVEL